MSRSNSRQLVKNSLLLLAGAAGIFLSALWLQHVAMLDPFAGRRDAGSQQGKRVAVRLEDVQMRQWDKGKLRAKAKVGRIDIFDNRQELTFFAVTDGIYYADKGTFAF